MNFSGHKIIVFIKEGCAFISLIGFIVSKDHTLKHFIDEE